MKRIQTDSRFLFSAFLLLLSLLFTLVQPIDASNGVYHWYCKKTTDHSPPPLPSEFSIIHQYDASYLNQQASANGDKVIYLTCDAGYGNENVKKILDTLQKHDAKGAFFVLAHFICANGDLISQMIQDGHLVCNHTARHKNMSKVTDFSQFQKELQALEDIYFEKTGQRLAKFYRPPEGTFSKDNLEFAQNMGYHTVFWSFAYADWDNQKQPNPQASLQKLVDHLHPGEILLLHPTSSTNATILDSFLTKAKEMGYRFGTLDELCKK